MKTCLLEAYLPQKPTVLKGRHAKLVINHMEKPAPKQTPTYADRKSEGREVERSLGG